MDTTSSVHLAQTISSLSVLNSSNRESELALQLLLKSLETSSGTAETPVSRVSPSSVALPGTGEIIDIVA